MNEAPKKSGWRWARRILIVVACLATLVAMFYAEEDWRGKRAWENCKRELEAKGAVLDWDKYIPPPVPDDQNFFTASKKIAFSFVHSRNDAESEFFAKQPRFQFSPTETNTFPVFDNAKSKPLVVAELSVLPSNGANLESAKNHLVVDFNSVGAREQVQSLIEATIGQSIHGAAGFEFSEFQLRNLVPAQIFVEADGAPSISDLESFIPADTATNIGHLRIEATVDKNIFHVVLTSVHITAAADYLKWSDQYESDFNEIREALKRPCAIIPGDYSKPYLIPIPNFIIMRALAQTLAQRAQCDFLLSEPDKALRELTLMHDVCRILEKPPTGQPMTLVEAMINVAISGLYVSTTADGFRLHAWQEPQLAALQKQLAEINLTPFVLAALQEGPAFTCRDAEILPLYQFMNFGRTPKWTDKVGSWLWPRGWTYQNMVNITVFELKPLDGFDLAHDTIAPRKFNVDFDRYFKHAFPYKILAAMAVPNLSKAEQVTAHNQTMVNEAQIVCALERYHLAHGEYPETLDALAPQFIEKIPHDLIGGEPLHYRRTNDGKFLLYSIGWDERDDGGEKHQYNNVGRGVDYTQGDWVWEN